MVEPNRQKMLLKAYRSLLPQAKIMVKDYAHLAPDADFKNPPDPQAQDRQDGGDS